ncbi:MAG: hypothetical protein H7322_05640 [Ramlibacter sp.]|nr:hypothetical protein [Ramlibacter sp.]
MGDRVDLDAFVGGAAVDPVVFELRPGYRVLLVAVDGVAPGASDSLSEDLLVRAEQEAGHLLADIPVEELPHIGAWREAYRVFGAKPQRTRNSLEALTRRAGAGLPRVNRLTDVYNALSVLHQVPLGGEDLMRYAGSPRLLRATGIESFDTTADGEPVIEHPDAGEVVWRDDDGVTCRRWNWRQETCRSCPSPNCPCRALRPCRHRRARFACAHQHRNFRTSQGCQAQLGPSPLWRYRFRDCPARWHCHC